VIRITSLRSFPHIKEIGGLTMSMKERLEVHRQIEQENARKLEEWKRKEGKTV
jgi:hypothetical protein